MDYDFSGWATRNDLKCADGVTIRRDAFKDNDGMTVPLVWNHDHNDSMNVLGHALLENREEGVYAYGKFNDTESGRNAKELVEHGDVTELSIYANQLQKTPTKDVMHGVIREVSLVLAGANPGAYIDSVSISHGEEESETEAIIYTGENIVMNKNDAIQHADEPKGEKTIGEIFETLTDEQKDAVYAIVGQAVEDAKAGSEEEPVKHSHEEDDELRHNAFENEEVVDEDTYISHSEMKAVIEDGKRYGSLRDSALAHGITNIDYLFPDNKTIDNGAPSFITRRMEWVDSVMNGVHRSPFSRIKSIFANLTESDARARGYIKGHQKAEEVFPLLKRPTSPTTIYKKQKLDRDDVIDIVDFDVVSWLKTEMRMMLDEEIARAILIGDGRSTASDDKIDELCIRPIATDDNLYTIKKELTAVESSAVQLPKNIIKAVVRARAEYRGAGNPTLYTTESILAEMLLIEDSTQRRIYNSVDDLAKAMRVSKIVTVPVMDGATDANNKPIYAICVNLNDYNVGADKGGAVNMFDDFDIDYNQQKYLIETRCSGALVTPYSAIVIKGPAAQAAQG